MSAFFGGLFAAFALICYAIGVIQQEYVLAIAGSLFAIACALCSRRGE